MTSPRANRRPVFYWQAVLILLPVVVLASVGLVSLRQDKLLAEQEAREQAQAIAGPLAHECGTHLKTGIEEFAEASWRQEQATGLIAGTLGTAPGQDAAEEIRNAQTIVARWQQEHPAVQLSRLPRSRCYFREGALFDPRQYHRVPEPPEWFVRLSPEQTAKWAEAQNGGARGDLSAARSALEAIAHTRLDDSLRANAELRLLLTEPEPSDPSDRVHAILELAHKYPGVQTEAGLPLSGIACYHAIGLAPAGAAFNPILDGFVFHMQNAPSILTGKLLDEIESRVQSEDTRVQERVLAIKSVWAAQERARELIRRVSPAQLTKPGVVELSSESGRFLGFCGPSVRVSTNLSLARETARRRFIPP